MQDDTESDQVASDDSEEYSPDPGLPQDPSAQIYYWFDLSHAQGLQVGDNNVQNINLVRDPRKPATFPYRVGNIPPLADSYLQRQEMEKLAAITARGGTAVLCQVLSGLGGVGKTQLAASYAQYMWGNREVDLLIWVKASTPREVEETYADALFAITGHDDANTARAARHFIQWLADTNNSWLVVLDDVARPNDLDDGLWPPRVDRGITVITTRRLDHSIKSRGELVEVGVFTPDEASRYLTTKLKDHLELADDLPGLADDLGYLPLALAQAATYLIDRNIEASEYRSRFADTRNRLTDLLPELGSLPDEYPSTAPDKYRPTVAATWAISVELADKELAPRGVSSPLLELASVLDSDGIPEAVFTAEATCLFLTNRRTVKDGPVSATQARDGLHCLHRLNLAHVDTDGFGRMLRVHRLVQRATRDMQGPQHDLATVVSSAADALMQAWSEIDTDRALAQRLRANTEALVKQDDTNALWNRESGCHDVLFRSGNSLGSTGLVTEAVTYFDDLREKSARLLGADHRSTLTARASFASYCGRAGNPGMAVEELGEVLADRIRILGAEDPDTLSTRARLAFWRGRAGDLAGAVSDLKQLLRDQLVALGPDHHGTLYTRASLASYRGRTGDRAGAAKEFEALLADQLRFSGPEHRDTLNTRASLMTFRYAGDPVAAIKAFEHLVVDYERVLGPKHPDTLAVRATLASYRGRSGDLTGTVRDFEKLLVDRLEVLGPEHPDTLATRSRLYWWRRSSGDRVGTVNAMKELLADQLRVLGPDHPDTLDTRARLLAWRKPDKSVESGALMKELFADQLRVLGPDHPDTLSTRARLAGWRGRTGDPDGAAEEFDILATHRRRVLGRNHPDTLRAWSRLAFWRDRAGDYLGAAKAAGILYGAERAICGKDAPRTLGVLGKLIVYERKAENHTILVDLLRQLVQSRLRVSGPDHRDTLAARVSLAIARGRAGDPADAVKDLQAVLADQQRVLDSGDPDILATRYHLAVWRRSAGDHNGAVKALSALLYEQQQLLGPDHVDTARTQDTLAAWKAKGPVPKKARLRPASLPQQQFPKPKGTGDRGDGQTPSPLVGLRDLLIKHGSGRSRAVTIALLEALALAGGHPVPREGEVWATMAGALIDQDLIVADADIDHLLSNATPYLEIDTQEGYTGYRLAHSGFARYVLDRAASQRRIDTARSVVLQQKKVVAALFGLTVDTPYIVRHLAWHVAEGSCWGEFARHQDTLEQLDPDVLVEEMLRTKFGLGQLPSDVATVGRLRPSLASLPIEDRVVVRRMATVRRTNYNRSDGRIPQGVWAVRWARLAHDPMHVTLTPLSPPRSRIRENLDSVQALVTVPVSNKRPLLAAGNREGIVRLWNPGTGQIVGSVVDTGKPVAGLCALPDSEGRVLLATSSMDGVQFWDPLIGLPAAPPISHPTGIRAMAAVNMPDGRTLLATGSDDGIIHLWQPGTREPVGHPMAGHDGPVLGIAALRYSETPSHLASVGEDGTLRIWDAQIQRQHGPTMRGHSGPVYAVAAAHGLHNRPLVVTGGHDTTVRLWNPVLGEPVGRVMFGHSTPVRAVAAISMPDRKNRKSVIATGGDDDYVVLWDLLTSFKLGGPLVGHTSRILSSTAVPAPTALHDRRILLATSSHDGSVRLWDVLNVKKRPSLSERLHTHVSAIATLENKDHQLLLATGHADGTVLVYDQNADVLTKPFTAHTGRITGLAAVRLPNDDVRLITVGEDLALTFWDLDGRIVGRFTAARESAVRLITPIALEDDNVLLAAVDGKGHISVWNPMDGRCQNTFPSGHVGPVASFTAVRLGNGGTALATGGLDRTIRLRSHETGELVGSPLTENSNPIHALTAIAGLEGRSLLAAGGNEHGGRITLWDPATGHLEGRLMIGHGDSLTAVLNTVRAASGAELLVSIGRAQTIRLWDPQAQRMLHRLDVEGPITACHSVGPWLAIGTERGVSLLELNKPIRPQDVTFSSLPSIELPVPD